MASIDARLDHACARLRVNPAQADDIREELRCHVEDAIQLHVSRGMDPGQAEELAIAALGDPRKLRDCLDMVHQGDPWWIMRLKGLAAGMAIGGLLAALLPIGGHLEFAAPWFGLAGVGATQVTIVTNALVVGGLIGLLSAGGRGLLVGWTVGSLVWLCGCLAYWIAAAAGTTVQPTGDMLTSILLAPLLGGAFGAAVEFGSARVLSATSSARPQIQ